MNCDARDQLNKAEALLTAAYWILDIWSEHLSDESESAVAEGVICLLADVRDIINSIQNAVE